MKIVGVNMDNLDNNLDMVTKGQQSTTTTTTKEDVANIIHRRYQKLQDEVDMSSVSIFISLVIFAFFNYRLIPRFDLTMFSSDK